MKTEKPARPSRNLLKPVRGAAALPHFLTVWGLVLGLVLGGTVGSRSAPAQTNAAGTNALKGPLSSNRYLIIVETSKSMQRRSEGTIQAVQDLLTSMRRQLFRGDTIGLWTYNDQLYAGRFPLQQWTPETHRSIASRILTYLQEQPFEKSAKLDSALTVMDKVIKSSGLITVFIISDGDQPLRGTPFDETINATFKSWNKEQQKARMPFVTLLRANKGTITEHLVTSSPWPVELPPLPPEAIPKAIVASNSPPPATAPKPAAPVAPLIISGRKNPPAPQLSPGESAPTKPDVLPQPPALSANEPAAATIPGIAAPTPPPAVESTSPTTTTTALTASAPPEPPSNNIQSEPPTPTAAVPVTDATAPEPPTAAPAVSRTDTGRDSTIARDQTVDSAPMTATEVAVISGKPFFGQRTIVIAGLLVAGVVFALGLVAMRRTRPTPHTSLITRSFDRESK